MLEAGRLGSLEAGKPGNWKAGKLGGWEAEKSDKPSGIPASRPTSHWVSLAKLVKG